MIYICDHYRHLICYPYNIKNLHKMADDLNINEVWYKKKGILFHSHYDIPYRRIKEIMGRCVVVSKREIIELIRLGKTPVSITEPNYPSYEN